MLSNIKLKFDALSISDVHDTEYINMASLFQGKLAGFVVDEAHCVRYAVWCDFPEISSSMLKKELNMGKILIKGKDLKK